MACLKVRGLDGAERLVPEDADGNIRTAAGDEILGPVWDCGPQQAGVPQADVELERAGVPWGDVIAWATDKLGIQKCSGCAARQELLNSAAKLGWAETIRQIRGTFT